MRLVLKVRPLALVFELIERIKRAIFEKEGIPVEDQMLIFDGMQLRDGHNVGDYELEDGDELNLVLALRGCACGCGMYPPWADENTVIKSEGGVAIAGQA
ncbi:hypothetical protein JCM5353_002355 [Sporobolomyces roseus]